MTCEFLNFFKISKCSYSENGVKVSVKKEQNEIINFFLIDRNMNDKEYLIKRREISEKEICDLVISYEKRGKNAITFCLVELKGSDINHAIDQVCRVFDVLKDKECCHHNVIWKVYICSHGSSPIRYDTTHERKLKDRFRSGCYKLSKNRKTDPFQNFLKC